MLSICKLLDMSRKGYRVVTIPASSISFKLEKCLDREQVPLAAQCSLGSGTVRKRPVPESAESHSAERPSKVLNLQSTATVRLTAPAAAPAHSVCCQFASHLFCSVWIEILISLFETRWHFFLFPTQSSSLTDREPDTHSAAVPHCTEWTGSHRRVFSLYQ